MNSILFQDRRTAGVQLAAELARSLHNKPVVVFGIPRGGIITADEVAKALSAPLDVLIARKIRAPNKPDLAIGAVIEDDNYFLNEELARVMGATPDYLYREIEFQKNQILESLKAYRGIRPPMDIFDKTVIVVDDGMATGYTLRAALQSLRLQRPARLIAAIPVASEKSLAVVRPAADEIIALNVVYVHYLSVSIWYSRFDEITDAEILSILSRNWTAHKKPVQGVGFRV